MIHAMNVTWMVFPCEWFACHITKGLCYANNIYLQLSAHVDSIYITSSNLPIALGSAYIVYHCN